MYNYIGLGLSFEIRGNGIRWNETKHVELEQFLHAFTSRGFDSVSWAFLFSPECAYKKIKTGVISDTVGQSPVAYKFHHVLRMRTVSTGNRSMQNACSWPTHVNRSIYRFDGIWTEHWCRLQHCRATCTMVTCVPIGTRYLLYCDCLETGCIVRTWHQWIDTPSVNKDCWRQAVTLVLQRN